MKKIAVFLVILLGTWISYSCSSTDRTVVDEESAEVTFQFDAKKVFDTKTLTAIDGYEKCADKIDLNTLSLDIELSGPENKTLTGVPLALFNGFLKTNPVMLKPGTYKVNNVIVKSSGKAIYAGVVASDPLPKFAAFIPMTELMKNKTFTLESYKKPTITLYVLCAQYESANDFGLPKFEISRTEVTCFDVLFNVCDKEGEHHMGEGAIYIYEDENTYLADKNNPELKKWLYKDEFKAGDKGTICFPDNIEQPDNTKESVYLVIRLTNSNMNTAQKEYAATVTVAQLLDFRNEAHWDPAMNAIHVVICGTSWCLFCPPVTECAPLGVNGIETFNSYVDVNVLKQSWPWDIKKNMDIVVDLKSGILPDKYIYVKGEHQGDVTWESPFFKYISNNKISIDAGVKKISDIDGKSYPGGESFDVWLHVNLLDANNNEVVKPEWKIKMNSSSTSDLDTYIVEFKKDEIKNGCYKLQIRADINSGKKEKFEFKMDNVKVSN